MVIPLRRAAVSTAFGLSVLLAAGAGACLAILLLSPRTASALHELPAHPWWFVYREAENADSGPLWGLGASVLCAVLAALAGARASTHAGRSGSPVALFFSLAFFTLSLEALRGPAALLFIRGHSISVGLVLTRLVYAGRFAGVLALLTAGLHALEMKYRKNLVLAGILTLVALAIALYVPVDRTAFLSSLVFKLGDEQGVGFADLSLGILAAASLTGAAVTRPGRGSPVLAAAAVLIFAGRQIVSFSGSPGKLAAGVALLAAGMGASLVMLGRDKVNETAGAG